MAKKPITRKRSSVRTGRSKRSFMKKEMAKANTKSFNAKVHKAVLAMSDIKPEVKQSQLRGSFDVIPYAYSNAFQCDNNNIIVFDPIISQGTADNARIGNSITFTKCKMRYLINCNPSINGASTIPTMVRLIFFYDREDPNSIPTVYANNNFINLGSVSTGLTGSLTDLFYRYNTDRYRILGTRTHKLGFADNTVNAGPGSQVSLSQYYKNNDSPMYVQSSIDCTDMIIKHQKFNDSLGLSMARKLYCLVMSVSQSGIGLLPTAPQNKFYYEIDFRYTDA